MKEFSTSKIEHGKNPSEQMKNVLEVFRLCPELEKVGTAEQYEKYLETVFPESKVKNIVWHGTSEKIDTYDQEKIGVNIGEENPNKGIYFTDMQGAGMLRGLLGGNISLPNLVNLQNPQSVKDLSIPVNPEEYDGIISKEVIEDALGDMVIPVFVVFKADQAIILGSKLDIEKFSEFVARDNQ